ncbi:MAG: DNA mismatch repair protein MutS [Bacteriovoracia bacterium]
MTKANTEKTPLMKQYSEVKEKYQDCLLFFRMGDFYELFFDDAKIASRILDIQLTSRNKNDPEPTPMCGVPHHSASSYIYKLVNAGFKVAVCEQLESPAQVLEKGGKGIVKRDVVRVISPGTQVDSELLDSKSLSLTHAAVLSNKKRISWATADLTTGFFVFGIFDNFESWVRYLKAHDIQEALFAETGKVNPLFEEAKKLGIFCNPTPSFYFDKPYATSQICLQFGVTHPNAVHPLLQSGVEPVGALLKYFFETQKIQPIQTISRIQAWKSPSVMELDPSTLRALDVFDSKTLSLFSFLDRTKTALGGRTLKQWLSRPLTSVEQILARQQEVEVFFSVPEALGNTQRILSEIYDIERLLSRLCLHNAFSSFNARDLRALAHSILMSQELSQFLMPWPILGNIVPRESNLTNYCLQILNSLNENPPLSNKEGCLFRKGYHQELDQLIELCENGESWLLELEKKEREKTGIQSLKVRFNRVFGYYIEITKSNLDSVPGHYIRKQTMAGAERFITEELKNFEDQISSAEKKRWDLEYKLFCDLCKGLVEHSPNIQEIATAVGHLDTIASLALVAQDHSFAKPKFTDTNELEIIDGWHPIVSHLLEQNGARYVKNSIFLSQEQPFLLITGPNMGGKSTVMRQAAITVFLAQIGSYVPAESATIGIVDQIFTRIGSSDNISDGESTFMVEMNEMSFILRNATKRSLILLDEIGRGTSTYDGLSLAWALASEIAQNIGARTLFATHYHELTELSRRFFQIRNQKVGVEVLDDKVHFLYHLEDGAAERSYGILVAKLAGLPNHVLEHAERTLRNLEQKSKPKAQLKETLQLTLF